MLAPEIEVEVTENGLAIRQPHYRIVPAAAIGLVLLLGWLFISIIRAGAHNNHPVATAIVLAAAIASAAACYRFRNYLSEPKIFLNPTGLVAQQGARVRSIPWAEARVDSYTHPGGVTVHGEQGQKILLAHELNNTAIVEEYLLRHVPRQRIKFAKDWSGRECIFLRAA